MPIPSRLKIDIINTLSFIKKLLHLQGAEKLALMRFFLDVMLDLLCPLPLADCSNYIQCMKTFASTNFCFRI
jgi:hypothetical protein